jgi:hypothetical protein
MASTGNAVGDQHRAAAAADVTYSNRMSATLANLISQHTGDISSLNNAIHTAEEILTDAPANIYIPSSCWENLGVLFEMRYPQTKGLEDLQAAITWAEQGVAAASQITDQVLCLNNLSIYLVSRYERMGIPEDLHETHKRMNEIRMTLENHPRPLGC